MEYAFRLAELFPEEICLVSKDLIPIGCPALKQLGPAMVKERLTTILDTIGKASSQAQSLHTIITSADKLRHGDQKMYLFCDFFSNRVVGFLKLGKKKLFVFDDAGVQHELNPLCILDFYIHETRQRQGAGKFLFDYMLREEQIPIEHFAVDRPSDKLIFFMRKHYELTQILPQNNNYVLYDGFFKERADYVGGKVPQWNGLDQPADRPMEGGFHLKHDISRKEDSLDYNSEHHLPPHFDIGQHKSQRRHQSQMDDIMNPLNNLSDLKINGDSNGNGHWSKDNNKCK